MSLTAEAGQNWRTRQHRREQRELQTYAPITDEEKATVAKASADCEGDGAHRWFNGSPVTE